MSVYEYECSMCHNTFTDDDVATAISEALEAFTPEELMQEVHAICDDCWHLARQLSPALNERYPRQR